MRYRLNLLNAEGTVTSTTELWCKTDERVIALIDDILPECTVELWQGDRLVAHHRALRYRA